MSYDGSWPILLKKSARVSSAEKYAFEIEIFTFRVFEGFHFAALDIRYSTINQRQGKAEVSGELVIMNWKPDALGGLF